MDYLGLDASQELLLFAASNPEVMRDLRLPTAVVAQAGAVSLRSDLLDMHLYVLSRWGGGGLLRVAALRTCWGCAAVCCASDLLDLRRYVLRFGLVGCAPLRAEQWRHWCVRASVGPPGKHPAAARPCRRALALLAAKPQLSSLKLDLIPALCRQRLHFAHSGSVVGLDDSGARPPLGAPPPASRAHPRPRAPACPPWISSYRSAGLGPVWVCTIAPDLVSDRVWDATCHPLPAAATQSDTDAEGDLHPAGSFVSAAHVMELSHAGPSTRSGAGRVGTFMVRG